MDDSLVYVEDLEHYQKIVKEVLKTLQDDNLFLKSEKCFFEKDEMEYLGVIVSKDGFCMDPKKIEGV
jgi:hypothetical protein